MPKATSTLYLDQRRASKKGKYFLRLRVTFMRQSKYYDLEYQMTNEEFERIFSSKKKSDTEKDIQIECEAQRDKAQKVIDRLTYFSFEEFEKLYYSNLLATDRIAKGFDAHIEEKQKQKRFGTAESYETAKNALERFLPNGTYKDYTPNKLREFEEIMLSQGRSISTVGIYLRSLRTIFNIAKAENLINDDIYPFGKRKYTIPSSANNKRALFLPDIAKIVKYDCNDNSFLQKAKDIWLFSYLSNGINMMDLCSLKWKNIVSPNLLEFVRAKTSKTKKEIEPIPVVLGDMQWEIINRWGNKRTENHIFPFLSSKNLNSEQGRDEVKNFTKSINKQLKKIGEELNLPLLLTTYVARHSYATIMAKSHMALPQIKTNLGHSSVSTTEKYVRTLPVEDLKNFADKLLDFDDNNNF